MVKTLEPELTIPLLKNKLFNLHRKL